MGILDSFLDNPEQAGLLNAAAQMLAASGPSTMPRSFGQVLASGIGGLQQGASQAMANRSARQNFDINNIKMRDAESDLKNQEAIRQREAQIRAEIMGAGAGGAAMTPQTPTAPTVPMGGSMMAGRGAQMPSWMPQQPAAQPQPKASAPSDPSETAIAELMREAQVRAKYGDRDGALKAYEMAVKMQPKYSTDFREARGPDGKLHNYQLADNGTWKDTGLAPKPSMKQVSLGNRVVFADENAMSDGQSFAMGQSPDSVASNKLGWANYNLSKSNAQKPTFNAELGGFVYAPNDKSPQGTFVPAAGLAAKGPKLTEDQAKATGWLVQAENAWKNMRTVAYGKDGKTLTSAATPGFGDAVASLPFGIGEASGQALRSKDRQKFIQGASSLSESLLRAATGAGVNKEEAAQKIRELTPQFGDSEELIQQKMDSIPLYIETLKVRSGGGAGQAANVLATKAPKAANGWSITKVN